MVIMGSAAQVATETVDYLNKRGAKLGVIQVRLYRPWPAAAFLAALPPTVRSIAVLDRTKEPGSGGEPLFLDVVATIGEAVSDGRLTRMPKVIGGRYGLSSKDFTPAMVSGIFDELAKPSPRPRFTVGINDDVTLLSLDYDKDFDIEDPATTRAVFYGLGSDGTVGANKNTIKILGSTPRPTADGTLAAPLYAQGYFVYDSKKSGSRTVSHLRFGPDPIKAPYLISKADFIGCHQWSVLERVDVLAFARKGTILLLNSPYTPEEVFAHLPAPMQAKIIDLGIEVYCVDALEVARAAGLGGRTNTVLQTCFFAISGVLPRDVAIKAVKDSITKTYGKKSQEIVEKTHTAVDHASPTCTR